jgi:hypothetical protein
MVKKINLFGKNNATRKEVIDKYPMMEYSAPRRIRATPMGEQTAQKKAIKNAFPLPSETKIPATNREGYHVKEQIGLAINEYWMPKSIFDPNHIRTKTYTIGEVAIMIIQGQLFRRASWPLNQFIQFRDSVDLDNDLKEFTATKENPAMARMESFITKVTIHADPIKKDVFHPHIEPWVPTQDDIFASDFQSFRIDMGDLEGKKKETKK